MTRLKVGRSSLRRSDRFKQKGLGGLELEPLPEEEEPAIKDQTKGKPISLDLDEDEAERKKEVR